ncbi:unnamed protein product [Fraxinus pennsylvanica]|uniref:Uncharacterized protein n=1 Tax=Fraxinus pennsylvanica TaxID=56036 RepID=A0AAD2EAB7_9LAMI|nr:unnamed protein product [Fraxinus pennsylvanica]
MKKSQVLPTTERSRVFSGRGSAPMMLKVLLHSVENIIVYANQALNTTDYEEKEKNATRFLHKLYHGYGYGVGLFLAKEYPAYDKQVFPYKMGNCQVGNFGLATS